MFAELEKVMAFSLDSDAFLSSLMQNVTGKKSNSGVEKTANYLKQLYGFDVQDPSFIAFKYFWKISDPQEKPLIAFIYAVNHDELLAESIDVLKRVLPGEKASVDQFEAVIESYHPQKYSRNTLRSMAQNIASSWKQAGFIEGKVKNIRQVPDITPSVACFAFLYAYLNGDRGEYILNNIGVQALCLSESRLRDLAMDCARKDLMLYQFAGSVTVISFTSLLNKIGIYGVTH
jgi:hypothetical protein